MNAANLHQNRPVSDLAGDQLASVSRHGRGRKPRDVPISDSDWRRDSLGESSKARAQHDRNLGSETLEARSEHLYRPRNQSVRFAHSRMPAIAAERKLASVPASMARKPSRARSVFLSGASAPIPPI